MLALLAEETRLEYSSTHQALLCAEDRHREFTMMAKEFEVGHQLMADNDKRDYFYWLLVQEVYS
jgi:hypothetical protein